MRSRTARGGKEFIVNEEEHERLIDSLLESDISEAEFLRLEAELIISPDAREAYYERVKLHAGLQEEARSEGVARRGAVSITAGLSPRKLDPILLSAIGALVLVIAVLAWKLIEETPSAISEPIASGYGVIADLADADWETGSKLSKGDLVTDQTFTLLEGKARIELFSGVVLVIEGPSRFTLVSEAELSLDLGRAQALIPEVAPPFQLYTPMGSVEQCGPEFAVEVSEKTTKLDVVDGSAQWLPDEDTVETITAGNTLHWHENNTSEITISEGVSMAEVEAGFYKTRASHLEEWIEFRTKLLKDPELLAYYAIEPTTESRFSLQDLTNQKTIGAVVLANQAPDRWNRSRAALDFSPMGSRVRVTLPGEHQSLTLMCWVKIDSLDRLYNSLFLTDGHELHEPHWQIMNDGRLFFSVRANGGGKGKDKHIAYSPPIWSPAQSGQWMHLTTVYDGNAFTITHYINGSAISIDQIPESLQPDQVAIGAASIGNWSEPRYRKDAEFAVRNLNGVVDEFSLWARPLSADEINEIWKTGKP
ncbi:MAG: hypothetical protein P1U58_08570 [Verrucomicrobiales bacterium]|nr:hypothetical protein [Verrucomicrobiales bacterium]